MPVTIVGNNTPTAGGVVYGDGTNYVSTSAGTAGQVLLSNGSSAPSFGTVGAAGGGTGNAFFSVSGPASTVKTYTFPNENMTVGYRNLPAVGTQTGSYTLAVGDVGKYVQIGSGGSITVPTSVFAEGDAITLYNNTTGNITITCSAPTAYVAGTNTVRTSLTLATRGVATILFYSATACVVTGNVS